MGARGRSAGVAAGWFEAAAGRREAMVLLAGRRVVAAPERRRSAERGDRAQARERVGECLGPGPVGLESQAGAATVVDDPSGDVQQPVAQSLGLGLGELAVEAGQLRPGQQVLGDERELQPGLVVLEGVVRQVAHPGVLAGADAVLDAGAAAVRSSRAAMSAAVWS